MEDKDTKGSPTPCRDFLRGRCSRTNCRFYHPSSKGSRRYREAEECDDLFAKHNSYEPMGGYEHPPRSEAWPHEDDSKRRPPYSSYMDGGPYEAPICKDFLNKRCRRGPMCNFRHEAEGGRNSLNMPYEQPPIDRYYPQNPSSAYDGYEGMQYSRAPPPACDIYSMPEYRDSLIRQTKPETIAHEPPSKPTDPRDQMKILMDLVHGLKSEVDELKKGLASLQSNFDSFVDSCKYR